MQQGDREAGGGENKEENLTSKIAISVSNFGVEVPAEQLSQIFEPFYRIPKNDFFNYGGTGLRLAIVRKLVEYLQGT